MAMFNKFYCKVEVHVERTRCWNSFKRHFLSSVTKWSTKFIAAQGHLYLYPYLYTRSIFNKLAIYDQTGESTDPFW